MDNIINDYIKLINKDDPKFSLESSKEFVKEHITLIAEILEERSKALESKSFSNLLTEESFQPNFTIDEKFNFLEKFFKVIFGCCNKLFSDFNVISKKSIMTSGQLVLTYKIIPNFDKLLIEMGYRLVNTREWQFTSKHLTPQVRENIFFVAMIIFFSWSNMNKIYKSNNLVTPVDVSRKRGKSKSEESPERKIVKITAENSSTEFWECQLCSFANNKIGIDNCEVCFQERIALGTKETSLYDDENTLKIEIEENNVKTSDLKETSIIPKIPVSDPDTWICKICSYSGSNNFDLNCKVCYSIKEDDKKVFRESNKAQITMNNKIRPQFPETKESKNTHSSSESDSSSNCDNHSSFQQKKIDENKNRNIRYKYISDSIKSNSASGVNIDSPQKNITETPRNLPQQRTGPMNNANKSKDRSFASGVNNETLQKNITETPRNLPQQRTGPTNNANKSKDRSFASGVNNETPQNNITDSSRKSNHQKTVQVNNEKNVRKDRPQIDHSNYPSTSSVSRGNNKIDQNQIVNKESDSRDVNNPTEKKKIFNFFKTSKKSNERIDSPQIDHSNYPSTSSVSRGNNKIDQNQIVNKESDSRDVNKQKTWNWFCFKKSKKSNITHNK